MDQQNPRVYATLVDYSQALQWVKAVRRCLPTAGIHWIEPDHDRCQCGKTTSLKRPSSSKDE
jgi:hypothetical protein